MDDSEEIERLREENLQLRTLVAVLSVPSADCWDANSDDIDTRIRSRVVDMVLRSLALSCKERGGENNLSVTMQAGDGDPDLDGWRWQVHVTKPGKLTPTEQHDEARAEVERLRRIVASMSSVEAERSEAGQRP